MKKKLTCHCGGVEAEVNIPETGIEKLMRCNCTLCKRKGYIIGVLGENDFTLTKGKELLKLYQRVIEDDTPMVRRAAANALKDVFYFDLIY